jgi:hypothetical protein
MYFWLSGDSENVLGYWVSSQWRDKVVPYPSERASNKEDMADDTIRKSKASQFTPVCFVVLKRRSLLVGDGSCWPRKRQQHQRIHEVNSLVDCILFLVSNAA